MRTPPTGILGNTDAEVLIPLCCAFYVFCLSQQEQTHGWETGLHQEAALTWDNERPAVEVGKTASLWASV